MHKYLRAANVTWSGLDLSDVKEMNFSPDDFKRFQLKYGDIL
jgi:type I restriction enzyme, S subunit